METSPLPNASATPARASEPLGALEQWRRDLRDGVHGQVLERPETWRRDATWTAARCEAASRLCEAAGIHDGAKLLLELGAALLAEAQLARRKEQRARAGTRRTLQHPRQGAA